MAHRKFQDLNLKDAFLFAAALSDAEICGMILELILGRKVPHVSVHAEHALLFSSDFRSVRLDIYADDEMKVGYNLEMQNKNKDMDVANLPKRSRYHQAEMDVTSLKPGEDFADLKPSYVIFICTFDPFGRGFYRYTFENRCLEQDFALEDETRKIFLNTKGTNDQEVPEELIYFLHYVEDTTDAYVQQVENVHIGRLHRKISELKKSREWEEQYMTFEELLKESRVEGLEAGREEGLEAGKVEGMEAERKRLLKLISCMSANGEAERILELEHNKELLEQMYQKYNL